MHNERHEELLAAAALGMPIDAAGEAEQQSWLDERCSECERLLPELRFVAASLGASVPARVPRPALKTAILSSLGPARTAPPRSSAFAAWGFAPAAALFFC